MNRNSKPNRGNKVQGLPIDRKVFLVKKFTGRHDCERCNGKGIIECRVYDKLDIVLDTCPVCKGVVRNSSFSVETFRITEILLRKNQCPSITAYSPVSGTIFLEYHSYYLSKKEAHRECSKRNAMLSFTGNAQERREILKQWGRF